MEGSTGAGTPGATGAVFATTAVRAMLAGVVDRRRARGKRYGLVDLLLVMVLAKLGGEDRPSGIADWVTHRWEHLQPALGLRWRRAPHHSTYRRVLASAVAADALDTAVGAFFGHLRGATPPAQVSIDGKTVRGTRPADRSAPAEHLLAAYLPQEGLVLGQVAVGEKTNEITAAPGLLGALDLRGTVVSGDAMHTQRALSTAIVAAGGAYVWVAKDNQPTLREEIATLFTLSGRTVAGGNVGAVVTVATQQSRGHGRTDTRRIRVSSDLQSFSDWPGLRQVFQLVRTRQVHHGKTTREVVYGLTSLPAEHASAARLLGLTRAHWGIENGLHYRRDVTFHEDATRLTQGAAGRVMATLNNLVIGLLQWAGYTNHAAARRRFSAQPRAALALLASLPRL